MTDKRSESVPAGTAWSMVFDPAAIGLPFAAAVAGWWPDARHRPAEGLAEFFAGRLQKDMAAGQAILSSRSLTDVQGVQLRYLQELASDYMLDFPRALMATASAAGGTPALGLSGAHADDHMAV